MIKTRIPLLLRSYIIASTGVLLALALLASSGLADSDSQGTAKRHRSVSSRQAAPHPRHKPIRKVVVVEQGDTFADILTREGVSLQDALFASRKANGVFRLTRLKPGHKIELYFTADRKGLQEIDCAVVPGGKKVLYASRVLPVETGVSAPEPPPVTDEKQTPTIETVGSTKEITLEKGDTLVGILTREGVTLEDALSVAGRSDGVFRITRIRPGNVLTLDFTSGGAALKKITYQVSGGRSVVLYNGKPVAVRQGTGSTAARSPNETGEPSQDVEAPPGQAVTATGIKVVAAYDPLQLQTRHPVQLSYELLAQGKVLSPIAPQWLNNVMTSDHGGVVRKTALRSRGVDSKARLAARKRRDEGFLRAPLTYRYISSGFTSHRIHPVTNTVQPHYGVDFAASWGTPVRAVGAGTVVYMGWDGGFGRVIRIRHQHGYVTHYGHLSRYAKGVRQGSRVKRGQTIGYVGMSGIATGPHLDFRVTYNGDYINPLILQNHFRKITGIRQRRQRV